MSLLRILADLNMTFHNVPKISEYNCGYVPKLPLNTINNATNLSTDTYNGNCFKIA